MNHIFSYITFSSVSRLFPEISNRYQITNYFKNTSVSRCKIFQVFIMGTISHRTSNLHLYKVRIHSNSFQILYCWTCTDLKAIYRMPHPPTPTTSKIHNRDNFRNAARWSKLPILWFSALFSSSLPIHYKVFQLL